MQHLFLKGTVTVLLLLLVTSLAWGTDNVMPSSPAGLPIGPSVPNLINFQGRLTDASGNPVADGSHTVNFTLWTLPSGGVTVWTENTSQTTGGGLFTHNLGSVTALDPTIFESYDSLYLQIQADGQTILPRIRLTSTPYTRVSQSLETGLGTVVTIRTYNSPWGSNLDMFDETGNYMAAIESDGDGSGGFLWVGRDIGTIPGFVVDGNTGANDTRVDIYGTSTTTFDMGTTGDPSVILPSSAINSAEMLDEPGIAAEWGPSFFFLANTAGVNQKVDSVIISTPAAGKVVVQATGYVNFNHTNGTVENIALNLLTNAAGGIYTYGVSTFLVPSQAPTATGSFAYRQPFSCLQLFNAPSATTLKIYLIVQQFSGSDIGNSNVDYSVINATYYPTTYGNTPVAIASSSSSSDGNFTGVSSTEIVTYQTADEFNAYKEQLLQAEVQDLKARLQKIEQQLNKTKQAGVEK